MQKQIIAYLLQVIGSVALVVAGFAADPIIGWCVLGAVALVHGLALEREVGASTEPEVAPAIEEDAGDA